MGFFLGLHMINVFINNLEKYIFLVKAYILSRFLPCICKEQWFYIISGKIGELRGKAAENVSNATKIGKEEESVRRWKLFRELKDVKIPKYT